MTAALARLIRRPCPSYPHPAAVCGGTRAHQARRAGGGA